MLMPSVSNAVVNLIIVGALLERWPQLKAHLSAGVALTAIASASLAILLPILRASRLVFAQQLRCRSSPRLILEIDIGERLSIVVTHDKAGVQFLDGPGRLAGRHLPY